MEAADLSALTRMQLPVIAIRPQVECPVHLLTVKQLNDLSEMGRNPVLGIHLYDAPVVEIAAHFAPSLLNHPSELLQLVFEQGLRRIILNLVFDLLDLRQYNLVQLLGYHFVFIILFGVADCSEALCQLESL